MKTKYLQMPFEVKELDEKGVFSGYGSTFGNIDQGRDMVVKGAYQQTLKEHDDAGTFPLMCSSHYIRKEIGEWLKMYEDDHGLFCKGKLWIDGKYPDPDAMKSYRGMKKKKGKMGLSIGYGIYKGGEEYIEEGNYWKLTNIKLGEVSVTPLPMNQLATVETVKSIDSKRDFEKFLRDAGFSKSQAVAITAGGFDTIRRESGGKELDELVKKIQTNTKIFGV